MSREAGMMAMFEKQVKSDGRGGSPAARCSLFVARLRWFACRFAWWVRLTETLQRWRNKQLPVICATPLVALLRSAVSSQALSREASVLDERKPRSV